MSDDLSTAGPGGRHEAPSGSRWKLSRGWRIALWVALAVVGVLATVVGLLPLVWPVPALTDTVPPRELADPDSRFVTVDGIDLHYTEAGSPDAPCTVILLHGFGASTFSWRDTVPALADRCRVIAFDRPAFGLTERPVPGEWEGTNPYTLEANAEQTVGLMDALGVERAVLVGHSAGAPVAVLVAAEHPERVGALVLEAPAIFTGGGLPSWLSPLLRTPQARRIGPLLVRRIAGPASDDAVRSAFADPAKVTPAVLEGYRRPLRADDWDRALWEYTAAPRGTDVRDLLGALQMPVLVVWGEEDTFVPPDASRRVAASLPGPVEELALAGIGHIPHEESPEVFRATVVGFLERNGVE